MDSKRAQALLQEERARVQGLLSEAEAAVRQEQETGRDVGDTGDRAQTLTAEGEDDAVVAGLQDRLAALDRAEQRLAGGTYGRSVRSGQPIPDERLEADPAAELPVEEARARRKPGGSAAAPGRLLARRRLAERRRHGLAAALGEQAVGTRQRHEVRRRAGQPGVPEGQLPDAAGCH